MTALLKDHPFPYHTNYARRVDIFKMHIKIERRTGWFTYKASQASRCRLQALIERNGIRPSVVTGSGHYSFLAADKQDLESSAWDNWKRAMAEREAEQKQTFEVGQMVRVTDGDGSFTARVTEVDATKNPVAYRIEDANGVKAFYAANELTTLYQISVMRLTPAEEGILAARAERDEEAKATAGPKHFGFVFNGKVSIRNGHRRKYKDYDMRKVSAASAKRLQRLLNSDAVEKHVEFSDSELTPTIYFFL